MRKHDAVAILAALAQDNRLDVFRLLVEAGPEGMPAGHIATSLRLPPTPRHFIWTGCATRASSRRAATAAR